VVFSGHVVLKEGIEVGPEKVKAITEWPRSTNVTKIRSLLGLASYFHLLRICEILLKDNISLDQFVEEGH